MGNIVNEKCIAATMRKLDEVIQEISPFAAAFKMMHEVEQEETIRAERE